MEIVCLCLFCKYIKENWECESFPNGIPEKFLFKEKHLKSEHGEKYFSLKDEQDKNLIGDIINEA